jgi:hypothetical protein
MAWIQGEVLDSGLSEVVRDLHIIFSRVDKVIINFSADSEDVSGSPFSEFVRKIC